MNNLTPAQRRRLFMALMRSFSTADSADVADRWAWLEAAHVVGQQQFALHWASHTAMLRFALQTRDLGEAAGQVQRLALVPLGHLLRRLPAGNSDRATVSALAPMPVDARLSRLIRQAAEMAESRCF
ncbi:MULTISPECIES: DUF3703 domain-containing protein [unclassified Polaromonas]|jgi:hypothetical protein|uniref:DUF3703 domain-containing protein n=1 Tax=unclassified Polaromonas TaxID=2638319 RepID=UPI000BD88F5F|nr:MULTISPECIES: DUF3703 domain-containing protein [unclassified Polaromonas]OYY36672.1 MAG: hypothetical protein B7Y60_10910 [Polaromonas sp. 35-63-35]OYZ18690.1 MAG: hypothetical protein B7Y28_14890 [Polaromonas sp. 16-63-31]OYZ80883.1 MAG: hypothetical protein B7Y09_00105 [Polaromonas sp. 24-63-21]OZA52903.1 MAG: hypothetical protein B7X88_03050 [Polaromonas sp. 17-63-33]OZA88246.1 MAG: hypothetical protein B7X65_06575 [Polaromonas sp. 39-63-25]